MVMSADIKALVDALGACERIAKTPMPFGYLAQLRIFILFWLITWPLGLTFEYGWATIPLVSVCAWMMLKIEEIAVQCEHPFGVDANDLPLDTICVTIERNLLEILRRAEHLRTHDDLAVDAKSFMARTPKP
jgi:putative membrane protein